MVLVNLLKQGLSIFDSTSFTPRAFKNSNSLALFKEAAAKLVVNDFLIRSGAGSRKIDLLSLSSESERINSSYLSFTRVCLSFSITDGKY